MTDWPDCPECETDVFVSGCRGRSVDWRCHLCGQLFDDDDHKLVVGGTPA